MVGLVLILVREVEWTVICRVVLLRKAECWSCCVAVSIRRIVNIRKLDM